MSAAITVRFDTLPHPRSGVMLKVQVIRGAIQHAPLLASYRTLSDLGQACERVGIPLFDLTGAPDPNAEHQLTIEQLRTLGFPL